MLPLRFLCFLLRPAPHLSFAARIARQPLCSWLLVIMTAVTVAKHFVFAFPFPETPLRNAGPYHLQYHVPLPAPANEPTSSVLGIYHYTDSATRTGSSSGSVGDLSSPQRLGASNVRYHIDVSSRARSYVTSRYSHRVSASPLPLHTSFDFDLPLVRQVVRPRPSLAEGTPRGHLHYSSPAPGRASGDILLYRSSSCYCPALQPLPSSLAQRLLPTGPVVLIWAWPCKSGTHPQQIWGSAGLQCFEGGCIIVA
jgi:hypothetical protein